MGTYSLCACSRAPGCFLYFHKCQKALVESTAGNSVELLPDFAGFGSPLNVWGLGAAAAFIQTFSSIWDCQERWQVLSSPGSFFRAVFSLAAALRPLIHFYADHQLCVCLLGLNASITETIEGNSLEIKWIDFLELRMRKNQMVDVFPSLQQLIVLRRSQKPHVFLKKSDFWNGLRMLVREVRWRANVTR